MKTPNSSCPFHAGSAAPAPIHPSGQAWPPGPPAGLTGWGLLRQQSRDLMGALAEWQRRYGDVVHLRIWPEHQIVLTDPQLLRELLTTHHDALIRWERGIQVLSRLHGQGVFIAEGEAWRRKRRALQPDFAARRVQGLVPALAQAAAQAFARWPAETARWPVESAFTALGMEIILRLMFSCGIGDEARRAEGAVHDALLAANRELYWPLSAPDWMPWKRRKRRALACLDELIRSHLQARLAQAPDTWPDDLLTRLLQLHRADPAAWPLQAVRDECMTIFLAGHETTAASLTWWAWCMAANPAAQQAARDEVRARLGDRPPTAEDLPALGYLGNTLQETLRLHPVAPLLLVRRCTRPIALGGWQFPARTLFLLPLQLMQRDPRWFPEPLAFRPERFAGETAAAPRGARIPFGDGPRICLGQHLALAEMSVIAAMLLQRYTLSVPEGMAPPQPVLNVSLRPAQPLQLMLAPLGAGG